MGKIRIKKSSRVHIKAARDQLIGVSAHPAGPVDILDTDSQHDQKHKRKESNSITLDLSVPPICLQNNPFSGIKIKKEQVVKQRLVFPEPQKENTALKKEIAKPKKKKDKIKLRREQFLKKLEVKAAVKAEEKKAIQRAKTPVVGDMNVLRMALPNLETIKTKKSSNKVKFSKRNHKKLIVHKKSKIKKKKRPVYHGLSEIKDFQKFLKKSKDIKDIKSAILEKIKTNSL